jgi:hypothetical protein
LMDECGCVCGCLGGKIRTLWWMPGTDIVVAVVVLCTHAPSLFCTSSLSTVCLVFPLAFDVTRDHGLVRGVFQLWGT